jgi:hypothetical protein
MIFQAIAWKITELTRLAFPEADPACDHIEGFFNVIDLRSFCCAVALFAWIVTPSLAQQPSSVTAKPATPAQSETTVGIASASSVKDDPKSSVSTIDPDWIKPEKVYSLTSGKELLVYKFGPQLELNMEAAIEFWIKIPGTVDLTKPNCVMSVAKNESENTDPLVYWGVYFNKDGFYLSRDGKTDQVPLQPMQFKADMYEAAALLPEGSGTRALPDYAIQPAAFAMPLNQWQHVVINARYRSEPIYRTNVTGLREGSILPTMIGQFEYQKNLPNTGRGKGIEFTQDAVTCTNLLFPAPTGTGTMMLTVGSDPDGNHFVGELGVIRIWDRQLSASEIGALKEFSSFSLPINSSNQPPLNCTFANEAKALPSAICPAIPSLICSLAMQSEGFDDAASYVAPDVYVMQPPQGQNVSTCDPLFSRRPLGMEPRAIWVRMADDQKKLQSIQIEYDQPGYWTWDILPERSWDGAWLEKTVSQTGPKPFGTLGTLESIDFCVSGSSERVPVILPSYHQAQREFEATLYGDALCIRKQFTAKDLDRILDSSRVKSLADQLLKELPQQNVPPGIGREFMQSLSGTPELRTSPSAIYKCAAIFGPDSIYTAQPEVIQSLVINSKSLYAQGLLLPDSNPFQSTNQLPNLVARFCPKWAGAMPDLVGGAYTAISKSGPLSEIVGIAGLSDGNVITKLRFLLSDGSTSPLYEAKGDSTEELPFIQRIPAAYPDDFPNPLLQGKPAICRFEGLVTYCDDQGMHAVRLAYSCRSRLSYQKDSALEAKQIDITALTEGRYLDGEEIRHPKLAPYSDLPANTIPDPNDPTNIPIHGNYTDAPVYRFLYDDVNAKLTLYRESFTGSTAIGVRQWDFYPESLTSPGSANWVTIEGDRLTPFVKSIQDYTTGIQRDVLSAKLVLAGGEPITLDKASLPVSIPPTSSEYNNSYYTTIAGWDSASAFFTQQRPGFIGGNWTGYNIAAMNPKNLQDPGVNGGRIFEPIHSGDKAYYASDTSQLFIPNTLIYVPINDKQVLDSTYMSDNSNEDQQNWSIGIGANIGCKLVGSFSLNVDYNSSLSKTYGHKFNVIRSRSVLRPFALVVDRSLIELSSSGINPGSSGFLGEIADIEAALLSGQVVDWTAFFERFGTHYPYAVTYGGTITRLDNMTESKFSDFTKSGFGVSFAAKANISKVAKVGAKGEYKSDASKAFSQATDVETGSEESVGGMGSEAVPVYLDLRPIYELLSPIYFDDPVVWQMVRPEVMRQQDIYLAACAAMANEKYQLPISAGWSPEQIEQANEAAAKQAADLAAASQVHMNSKVVLRNKSTGRYISKMYSVYRLFGAVGYSNMTSANDSSSAAIFQLRSSMVDNPDDSSVLSFNEAGVAIGFPTNAVLNDPSDVLTEHQKRESSGGYLTVMTHSIGYTSDVTYEYAKWQFIKASDGNSGDVIQFGDEIRIKNVGANQFLYDYDGEYLWSSSTDDETNIWVISAPPGS